MLSDLRIGTRRLLREPGYAAVAILTLALGMGATTAIYTVVHGVLLRSLPYGEPERLVSLWTEAPRSGLARAFVGAADYLDWRAQSRTFEDMALVRHIANYNVTSGGEPERLQGARITANLFSVLRVRPVLGRAFREDEQRDENSAVAILSYELWQRRFGGDPGVVGSTILLDGVRNTVVAVMGPDFQYPSRDFQIWKPLVYNPEELRTRVGYSFLCVGRLRPGATLAGARAELLAIAARLDAEYPGSNKDVRVVVAPFLDDLVSPVRTALLTLLGAVACLLLIGCANLSHLLLVRASARSKELAVRGALGASRGRIVRQAFGEVVPLCLTGGVLGLVLAQAMLDLLLPLLPATMPRLDEIRLSPAVLGASFLAMALTALLVGALPAWQSARVDLGGALHAESRGGTASRGSALVRDALVVAQIGAALVLLVGAGLLGRSFLRLRSVNPGFETDRILTVHLAIARARHPADRDVAAFCEQLMQRVGALPGVTAVGMVNRLPLAGGIQGGPLEVEGKDGPVRFANVDWRTATPDYFRALGIPLLRGRSFGSGDVEGAPLVGVIDEAVAARVFPGQDPIGRRFRGGANAPWAEIVGVVGHLRHDSLAADERPQVYWNYAQRTQDRMALVVRTEGDPRRLARPALLAVRSIDPQQAAYDVRTMTEVLDRSIGQQRLNALLFGVFAAAAVGLAALGVFGVVAYSVGRRLREFGVRLALGAAPRRLFLMVLRQGARVALTGVALGALLALGLARLLTTLVFDLAVTDPGTYAAASAVMLVAALLAGALPAWRAARLDPAASLRAD